MTPARRDVLLDAGPLVGVLDRRDQWAARTQRLWPGIVGRCLTSEAALTEASHVLARGRVAPVWALDLVREMEIPVVALDARQRATAAALMRQYEDLPMDYADATLVVLGEALGIERVFTFDERGFRTYRTPSGRAFTLLEK